jgi:hypothetical protein
MRFTGVRVGEEEKGERSRKKGERRKERGDGLQPAFRIRCSDSLFESIKSILSIPSN